MFLNTNNNADGNLYVSLPDDFLAFGTEDSRQWFDLEKWRDTYNWDKNGATLSINLDFDPDSLELKIEAQELPNVVLYNNIDTDMFGKPTKDKRVPGPIDDLGANLTRVVDPRVTSPTEKNSVKE